MNFSVEETEEKVFKNTWVSYLIISQEAVERQKKKKGEREMAAGTKLSVLN